MSKIKYKGKVYEAVDESAAQMGKRWADNLIGRFKIRFINVRAKIYADDDGVWVDVLNLTSMSGDFQTGTQIENYLKRFEGQTWKIKDFKVKTSEVRQQGYTANVKFNVELTAAAEKFLVGKEV